MITCTRRLEERYAPQPKEQSSSSPQPILEGAR